MNQIPTSMSEKSNIFDAATATPATATTATPATISAILEPLLMVPPYLE